MSATNKRRAAAITEPVEMEFTVKEKADAFEWLRGIALAFEPGSVSAKHAAALLSELATIEPLKPSYGWLIQCPLLAVMLQAARDDAFDCGIIFAYVGGILFTQLMSSFSDNIDYAGYRARLRYRFEKGK